MKNEEFSEVLRLHGDMAYRMACHLTRGNESLARDLVQDAFVKIWKNWERQRPDSFKGWLYRVLHNLYMDHLRKQKREASVSYDAPSGSEDYDLKEALPDHEIPMVETLEQNEMKDALQWALNQLPADFRVPIVLCDMEGLSYEEIALVVDCPIGTVRSRIHRGRRELRRTLVQKETFL